MNKKQIQELFDGFKQMNCLIVGDVMVDAYIWGNVNRISPEAPVPVFEVNKRENRLGGAANVALNIQALGASPILCGVIGKDGKGDVFKSLLKDLKLSAVGIVTDPKRATTSKTRIISSSHHLLRVDEEEVSTISEKTQGVLFEKLKGIIEGKQKIDVIIFEDYDKGVLSPSLIQKITSLANKNGIPCCVDPKKNNFSSYQGSTLFKPNFKEFISGIKQEISKKDFKQLEIEGIKFLKKNKIKYLLLTLSELGMMLISEKESIRVPAQLRNIADVSGAGDTVVSVAALSLAAKISNKDLITLANLSGGLVCEQVGVVPVDKLKLQAEFIQLSNQK